MALKFDESALEGKTFISQEDFCYKYLGFKSMRSLYDMKKRNECPPFLDIGGKHYYECNTIKEFYRKHYIKQNKGNIKALALNAS